MVAVAILALLVAIAIPNFLRAKDKSIAVTCQANARQLQTAIENAAISSQVELKTNDLSEDAIKDIVYPDYIKSMPKCPKGSYYTDASGNVMCTYHNAPSQ